MASENAKKVMRRNVRILTGVIAIILLLGFTSVFYRQNHRFTYGEHLDDTVLTFEDENITLRQFGYYVFEVESFTQKQALSYNRTDPLDYWNTHFSAGNDSQFVSEIARQSAINRLLTALVYEKMAKEAGRSLTDEEKQEAGNEAEEWLNGLTEAQKETLGIRREDVVRVLEREKLAKPYAYEYSGKADLTGYSGDVTLLLSGGGAYFEEKLLSNYSMKKNEKLIAELKFGRITVNQ